MKTLYHFTVLLGLIVTFQLSSTAQNLVPNPGFEIQDTCPKVSEIWLAPPWHSPTLGSPDLFNTSCNSQQGDPRTGIGSSGFFTYSSFPNNREYIQVRLTSPLAAGQNYCVEFYVLRDDFMSLAVDKIGAHFSTDSLHFNVTSALTSLNPQVEHTGAPLTTSSYTKISGSFTASGGEEWVIFGNFRDDAGTTMVDVENNSNKVAYYNIDDINIFACSGTGISTADDNTPEIITYPNPAHGQMVVTMKNIHDLDGLHLRMLNTLGQQVLNISDGALQDNHGTYTVNLTGMEPGLYFITATINGNVHTQRVIVQ